MNTLKLFFLILLPTVAFLKDFYPSISSSKIVSSISSEISTGSYVNFISYNKMTNPVTDPDEIEVGKWTLLPGSILIIKKTNDTYWLLQTDENRSYYLIRGLNFLFNQDVQISKSINKNKLSNEITSQSGLMPSKSGSLPSKWETNWWTTNGYLRNAKGEFVKTIVDNENSPITTDSLITSPLDSTVITPIDSTITITKPPKEDSLTPSSEKIKIPVGAIMWDSWYRDYWNDENPPFDLLINHVSKARFVATEWMDKFNVVPFYGQYHEPEKIKIRYNVKWSTELGRNIFDEIERNVQVRYDKSQADTDREIQYYAEAGFDFLCFNYYNSDSPLSEARLQFVNSQNKRGLKMTFILASNRKDDEINYITDLMLKDYWFKIDNKPVLYFSTRDMQDLEKYKSAYQSKGGGEIYVVYYSMGGYPGEFSQYQQFKANAGSSYTLFMGQGTADMLIKAEVEARNTWMGQYKNTQIDLIPVLTTGFENLFNRSSLDTEQAAFIEKATLPQLEEKLELMKVFIKEHPEKVPAVLWYAANEILESGNPIVPTKRRDGTIDTSVLDTIKKHLE